MTEQKPRSYRTPVGQLRHRVTVQVWSESGTDSRGQPTGSWSDAPGGTVWGFVEPLSGRSLEAAHQLYTIATHRVTVSWGGPAVTKQNRIRFGDRTFAIGWAKNVNEDNHTLELLCSEGDP